MAAGEGEDDYLTVLGKTISTDDFYEGQVSLVLICNDGSNGVLVLSYRPLFESLIESHQGRLDGAVCEYTEADKMAYLQEVSQKVILNNFPKVGCLESFSP